MFTEGSKTEPGQASEFERQADQRQSGLFAEVLQYLAQNRKWWLTPIIIVLLLIGGIVALAGTGAAPFIYTIF